MQETAGEVFSYLQASPVFFTGLAFVAGFAASKSIAFEGRSGFIFYFLVGSTGLFLSQFVIVYFELKEYLEELPRFRFLFDFIAAYIGAFVIAAIMHFVKPI